MALIPVNPPSNIIDCTTCTATRNITVNFTAVSPAPANGYIVKWKKASESIWTTNPGANPTTSPVTIYNVPACENIDVSVQSSCGGSQVSSEVFAVAAGLGFALKCGCNYEGSTSDLNFYQYPNVALDFTGVTNGSTITLSYNAITRANKFDVYNETDLTTAGTSNWVGDGGYSGPWSPGSPGIANGSFSFTYNSAKTYTLRVAVAGADPGNQLSDSWSVSLGCEYTPPPPTYYYYTGLLCGGSIVESFRSTNSNVGNGGEIVKAMCATCGNTEQCFDNISPTATPTTNDIIAVYSSCATCTGGTGYNVITTFYNPCTINSTNGLASSDVFLVSGVSDVSTGVVLYDSSGNAHTTITMIADQQGNIYNVNQYGVVGSYSGITC